MKSDKVHEKPMVLRPTEGVENVYSKIFWKVG